VTARVRTDAVQSLHHQRRDLHQSTYPVPLRRSGLILLSHPSSTKGHRFILMMTDYFSKWVEVVPLRNMTHSEVISFVSKHIIHRFGVIPGFYAKTEYSSYA
jgi:hypothetical protein